MASTEAVSVLLIDDNADKLTALESILWDLDVRVIKAHSGREALRHLLNEDFALILLDVRMPDLDGFETAALIRQRPRSEHTPIIFVTAFPDETHVARGYSLHAVDYMITPVLPEVLRTKVSVFVDLFRAASEVRRQADVLRQRTEQLHRLTAVSLVVNSAATFDAIVAAVADGAREILGVDRAVVEATLDDRRVHHALAGGLDGDRPPLDVRLRGRDGRGLGSIEVSGKRDGLPFTPEDEDLLLQLGQTASVAIENLLFGEAREANRLKDEFLATVSHELRTPLSALLSWTWILRRGGLDASSSSRALEAIERNAKSQARIIDDLLDVSRIVTGRLRLTMVPVVLPGVVEGAVESAGAAAAAKQIQLVTRCEPGVDRIRGDADRLQQVIWNLLWNAIKFTPEGGRVEVAVAQVGSEVVVSVTDTGRGIPAAFLPHVFEPFRQADPTPARIAGGLGLGLAIVRQIVELHGGRVEADSPGEGQGATFLARFPSLRAVEPSADEAPTPTPAGPDPAAAIEDVRGLRVLVVEDDVDTREAIAFLLGSAGAVVETAASVPEALEAARARPPDILVCDIGLPGEDGYALVRRLRAEGRTTPAVALTAFARGADRERALAVGFQGHLAKPVDPGDLFRTLAHWGRGTNGERRPGAADHPRRNGVESDEPPAHLPEERAP
jgi:signal transduction histidine kinase